MGYFKNLQILKVNCHDNFIRKKHGGNQEENETEVGGENVFI